MAKVLIVHHRAPWGKSLLTYEHNLYSLRKYSDHECLYLNTARSRVPLYLKKYRPDLVVFHHTFLSIRQMPAFDEILERLDFIKDLDCPRILIAQDEQVRMDLAVAFIREFGLTRVFSPAPPALRQRMYSGVDFSTVRFHHILNGYIDDSTVRMTQRRFGRHQLRPIDVGYRTWYTQPFYGRHGQLKQQIADLFARKAPEYGLSVDISKDVKDALWGKRWFDFLLNCKYTIGVEGGCSVFDWDGTIAERTLAFVSQHPSATFEEIESACFPGLDGGFECFSLSPRHLEAAITRTCQVLIEGHYAGILKPGTHFIELKRDLSNIDEVLGVMREDRIRESMVEQTYRDIVASGRYSYRSFVDLVFGDSLPGSAEGSPSQWKSKWNRLDELVWQLRARAYRAPKSILRRLFRRALGEERLARVMDRIRGRDARD